MNKSQFQENERSLLERLKIAKTRAEIALNNYNAYNGKDYAEEHRLSVIWQNADAKVVTCQAKLDNFQKENFAIATA